jgi:hypothetical protein
MSDTAPPTDPKTLLLMECSLILSSFRWKLEKAGYPFREPPNLNQTLAQIDALCFPPELVNTRKSRAKPKAETVTVHSVARVTLTSCGLNIPKL